MSKDSIATHIPIPPPYPPKGLFDYTLPFLAIPDPDQINKMNSRNYWTDYCKAIYYAGTTLYFWNEFPELKAAFLSACCLRKGQTIFLISKYGAESGLTPALKSLLGKNGRMTVQEIGSQAIDAFHNLGSTPGTKLQWNFNYLDSLPEGTLDRVILFGAASHVANWNDFARQIYRALRDGGKVIIAEVALGGKNFRDAIHFDAHCEAQIGKVLEGIGVKEEELPSVEAEYLAALFQPFLRSSHAHSCEGLYLFYGQKGNGETDSALEFPDSTGEVQAFLKTKSPLRNITRHVLPGPVITLTTAWDFLAEPERAAWGQKVADIKRWTEQGTPEGVAFFIAGGWMWHKNREITDVMYSNLMARPGDKALIIGEALDMTVMDELRKRVGESGELVRVDLAGRPDPQSSYFKDWPEKRAKYMAMGIGEEWPYDFADNFPDNYFDLIFLPQGVHHSNNWLRDAPRLLRALKPGGQVMAIECGVLRPEWFAVREKSALARLIIDRIYDMVSGFNSIKGTIPVPPECRHEGRPDHDVSVAHLRQAFGDTLTDVIGLEWKGWILFWGYKK